MTAAGGTPQAGGGTPAERMTEDELLERMGKAMLKAAVLPPRSLARSIQWAVYDTYAGELSRRAAPLLPGVLAGMKRRR